MRAALLWLVLTVGPAHAFDSVHMGPVAGVTVGSPAALEVDDASDVTTSRTAGFAVRYRTVFGLRRDLAVEITPGYAQWSGEVGYQQVDPQQATLVDTHAGELRLGAIDLPVRGRWRAGSIAGVAITAVAGPTLSVRLVRDYDFARVRFDQATGVSELASGSATLDDAARFVLSGVAGVEFDRRVGEFLVSLGLTYHTEFGDTLGTGAPVRDGYAITAGRMRGLEVLLGLTTHL